MVGTEFQKKKIIMSLIRSDGNTIQWTPSSAGKGLFVHFNCSITYNVHDTMSMGI